LASTRHQNIQADYLRLGEEKVAPSREQRALGLEGAGLLGAVGT